MRIPGGRLMLLTSTHNAVVQLGIYVDSYREEEPSKGLGNGSQVCYL